jgi:alkylhydroperoxidase/carboxymuconolactone decarboxylase family protein YurZ
MTPESSRASRTTFAILPCRRHIKNAFRAGATVEEIMEVLKLSVVQVVQACNLGVTLLAEELERDAAT